MGRGGYERERRYLLARVKLAPRARLSPAPSGKSLNRDHLPPCVPTDYRDGAQGLGEASSSNLPLVSTLQ